MEKDTPGASLRVEIGCCRRDANVDFLCDAGANGVDGQAMAALDDTGFCVGAVSHRESLWTVRGDDARAVRNRVSGLGRRANVVHLPFSVQTAGSKQGTRDLRTVPAAVRLEFVVCVAEFVAPGAHRRTHGAEFASRRYGCASAFFGESVPACSAASGALRHLAILVHDARGKACAGHVVEKAAAGPLCPYAGTRSRWKNCGA